MKVKLITATADLEKHIAYCARVSNPANQDNENIIGLLNYCARHGHWSIFEMANIVMEIETSRAIAAQILRHRTFSFQEFSQRYSNDLLELELTEARRQDSKNRQNSIDDMVEEAKELFARTQLNIFGESRRKYDEAIEQGVAKECARMLLPLGTKTRMYVNGTVRSWIHYLTLRTGNGTQLEHKQIADAILDIFTEEWPLLGKMIRDQQLLDAITKQISILDKEAKLTLYSTLTNKGA